MSRAYVAVQITLTTANTPYDLATLVRAIASEAPGGSGTLVIQSDLANAASSKVSIGDTSLSTTRYGYQLGVGDTREYPNGNSVWTQLKLMGSVDGTKVNVEILQ